MRREASPPRKDLAREFGELGFVARYADGAPYWDESVRYVFSLEEIERDLEAGVADLHALALDVVDRAVGNEATLARLKIPRRAWDVIAESWRRRDPSLYGRFDFSYDGSGPPKLLEYNADTPTSLFEAAVLQWRWLEALIAMGELPTGADQFNSLHEKLIARWAALARGGAVHFACEMAEVDDRGTLAYIQDCAQQGGIATLSLDMADIGLKGDCFYDRSRRRIAKLFKLYPWEWMLAEPFGQADAVGGTQWIEPPWKLILSCKGALALMWDCAANHPNLLACGFEDDPHCPPMRYFARKPLYSREGANIELFGPEGTIRGRDENYGGEGFVRQALCPLPNFDGQRPLIGAWVVGDEPAGIGLREDASAITTNRARFVPHVILD